MTGGEALSFLPDGGLRVEAGPISLVLRARREGRTLPRELEEAGRYVVGLLAELADHRAVIAVETRRIRNAGALPPVVRRMVEATELFPEEYVTPLAAVAGTVADCAADFLADRGATWVVVNNGGDIALRLAPGEGATVGVMAAIEAPALFGRFRVAGGQGIGGVASSGVGGRSFTLGIADAVTVVGATASRADAAATLVANRVDLESPAVERVLAETADPGTDLRGLRVTRSVGPLSPLEVGEALDRGARRARELVDAGVIRGAILSLRGQDRIVGWPGDDGFERLPPPVQPIPQDLQPLRRGPQARRREVHT